MNENITITSARGLIGRKVYMYEDELITWTTATITKVYIHEDMVRVEVLSDKSKYNLVRLLVINYTDMYANGCAYLDKLLSDKVIMINSEEDNNEV